MTRSMLVLLAATACGGSKDEPPADDTDTNADADADTDTDADTDADADADSDADADTGETGTGPASCPPVYVAPVVDFEDCRAVTEVDTNNDGAPERTITRTFDLDGNVVRTVVDVGNDGTPELTSTFEYDASGLLVGSTETEPGPPPAVTTTTYTYDAAGLLLSTFEDGPGPDDTRQDYTNGACGPTSSEVDNLDDGTVDTSYAWTYTATDSTVATDLGDDGTVDSTIVTDFDPVLGRLDSSETENDATHAGPEVTRTYTYDAVTGLLTRTVESTWDGTGMVVVTTNHTYNPQGREVLEAVTQPMTLPVRSSTTWTCPP